jgi:hypothetical protein
MRPIAWGQDTPERPFHLARKLEAKLRQPELRYF